MGGSSFVLLPLKNKGWLPSLNPQISRYPNNTPWEADL